MRKGFFYTLALAAAWPIVAGGCASKAVDRPAYPSQSWTGKVGSSITGGASKVAAAVSPKKSNKQQEVDAPSGKPSAAGAVALAQVCERSGDFELADDHYQKALAIDPGYLPALLGVARLEDRRDHFAEAKRYYQKAIKKHPKDAGAHNDLGLCYHRRGMLPDAAKSLQKAVELRPNRTLYRDNLAAVLVDQGKPDEALQQLTMAHGVAVGNYNLGYLLAQKHDNSGALVHFRKALEKDPSYEPARQWVAQLTPSGGPAAQLASGPLVAPGGPMMPPNAQYNTSAGYATSPMPADPYIQTASTRNAAYPPSVNQAPPPALRYPDSRRDNGAFGGAAAPMPY